MLGMKNILPLTNAMHRAGLEPEGCLRDASWDAYNGARLMETTYFSNAGIHNGGVKERRR